MGTSKHVHAMLVDGYLALHLRELGSDKRNDLGVVRRLRATARVLLNARITAFPVSWRRPTPWGRRPYFDDLLFPQGWISPARTRRADRIGRAKARSGAWASGTLTSCPPNRRADTNAISGKPYGLTVSLPALISRGTVFTEVPSSLAIAAGLSIRSSSRSGGISFFCLLLMRRLQ